MPKKETELKKQVKNLVTNVELVDVILREGQCKSMAIPATIDMEDIRINYNFKLRMQRDSDKGIFFGFIAVNVKAVNSEEKACFDILSEYVLVYNVSDCDAKVDDEVFERFLETTVFFNAYPYLREEVQSCSTKLGFPPLVMPLHRPGRFKIEKVDKNKSSKKAKRKNSKQLKSETANH